MCHLHVVCCLILYDSPFYSLLYIFSLIFLFILLIIFIFHVGVTLSVDRSGVRDAVVSALQQLGAARKYGRAPPTAVARTATVAGHPSRQVGKDETLLRAVSAWLGERGITPRNPRWMTMVRSEAVQRMALAEKGNAMFPSIPVTPAFSVRQSSSDAVT